jgi:predicted metal-dependent phosphoesterase TrpH
MIVDLHTHSHASDGALAPAELLKDAVAAGVQCFALTDHDTVAGYRWLRDASPVLPEGFRLLAGVELSCVWSGVTVHVVGLGMDIDDPGFTAGLERLDAARKARAGIIAERLEALGMPGALEGARSVAGASQIGRPHFAEWMLAQGHVTDLKKAFDKYLGNGKTGDVKTCWPALAEVVAWITAAGGTAVLAHPLKYRLTRTKLKRLIVDFIACGGTGFEVYSGRQTREQTQDLCRLARDHGLQVSVGSDFHAALQYSPRLGFDTTELPEDLLLLDLV